MAGGASDPIGARMASCRSASLTEYRPDAQGMMQADWMSRVRSIGLDREMGRKPSRELVPDPFADLGRGDIDSEDMTGDRHRDPCEESRDRMLELLGREVAKLAVGVDPAEDQEPNSERFQLVEHRVASRPAA